MSASPDERHELIERIQAATLDQMFGWGIDRYERVFRTLAAEQSASEDTDRCVLRTVTVESPIPYALKRELVRVDAPELTRPS